MARTFPGKLLGGYRSFLGGRYSNERERYEQVADVQSPAAMVIACCDSRVSPTVVFDARPGELFIARNIANLVPPYDPGGYRSTSAAIEYAVLALGVKHIVVLGHARCGGVMAYARKRTDLSAGDFVGRWMSILEPAACAAGIEPDPEIAEDAVTRLEHAAIRNSLANLKTFPFVRERVERGELTLHGAYFSVATGTLELLDGPSDSFVRVGRRGLFFAEKVESE